MEPPTLRFPPPFALVLALAAALLLAFACKGGGNGDDGNNGGDDATSALQTFLDDLSRAEQTASERTASLDDDCGPGILEEPEPTRCSFEVSAESSLTLQDDLRSLNPPDEAVAHGDELAAAMGDIAAAQQTVAGELEGVTSVEEMEQVLDAHRAEFDAGFLRYEEACRQLEALALDAGIPVDLSC
jgi:hypothetical protein